MESDYVVTKRHIGILKQKDNNGRYTLYINGNECPFIFPLGRNLSDIYYYIEQTQNKYLYIVSSDKFSFKGIARFLNNRIYWDYPEMKKRKNKVSNSIKERNDKREKENSKKGIKEALYHSLLNSKSNGRKEIDNIIFHMSSDLKLDDKIRMETIGTNTNSRR